MTKKTLYKILAFSASVIALTAILILSVFYTYNDNTAENNLITIEALVENELERTQDYSEVIGSLDGGTRITLIDSDGTVLADSAVDVRKLGNHSDRQEFKEAKQNKSSTVIRRSETLNEDTYYYAKQLDDGRVLRVSTKEQSVAAAFKDVAFYIVLCLLFVLLACVIVSIFITKSIVKPIEEMGKNLDRLDEIEVYDELKPFTDAIKEQTEKKKELDRQKKQFTANFSHELKTPLTSIAGYAELIETGMAKEEDIKPFAHTIRAQALRLVSLSEDIIQLSQLEEKDDEKIVFESVDLYAVAQTCVNSLSINAMSKNVTLSLEGEECFVRGVGSLIEELIYNLIDNAVRYNKENGSVTVIITDDADGGTVTVKDTGIGIDEKYRERIFERFFRVDKSRSKETGGTGLGLAIVKHIAKLHGAQIEIDSVLNEGTKISVHFVN